MKGREKHAEGQPLKEILAFNVCFFFLLWIGDHCSSMFL